MSIYIIIVLVFIPFLYCCCGYYYCLRTTFYKVMLIKMQVLTSGNSGAQGSLVVGVWCDCERLKPTESSCHSPCNPLSLLFCWWAELADRSSGTSMASSPSSDTSLGRGLSLPGRRPIKYN